MYQKYLINICDCSIVYQKCVHISFLLMNAIMLVILIPVVTKYCKMGIYYK